MRNIKKITSIFLVCFCFQAFAIDSFTYKEFVPNIRNVKAPEVKGNFVIFTQSRNLRHAGIAFDFEDYKTVHHFLRIPSERETQGEGILFYILELPETKSEIRYRVELDGLWVDDPTNPNYVYDHALGMSVSVLRISRAQEYKTCILENGNVQFYFKTSPGETVRLAGSFNNWDPFMYELNEVRPGEYFLVLPLPRGEWLYAFFVSSTRYIDPTNHRTKYSIDGKKASVIQVP